MPQAREAATPWVLMTVLSPMFIIMEEPVPYVVLIIPFSRHPIDSCGMLLSAIHEEDGEEKLHLLMVDDHIPAGAKLY